MSNVWVSIIIKGPFAVVTVAYNFSSTQEMVVQFRDVLIESSEHVIRNFATTCTCSTVN